MPDVHCVPPARAVEQLAFERGPWAIRGCVAAPTFASISKAFRSLPRADKPVAELFRDAMRVALGVVPADGWAVLTLDPATLLVTGGVHEHALVGERLERLWDIEYGEDDVLKFAALARELTPVAILSEATRSERTKSVRFRELLAPAGYDHEIRAALRSMKHTWGALFWLRRAGTPDFSPEEEAFVRELADALGESIRVTLAAASAAADTSPSRATLLLGPDTRLLAASPASDAWLEELASDGPRDPTGISHHVRSIVNGARRGAERGGQTTAHVRVRGRSGRWLTVHAAVLGDGNVVVTLEDGRPIGIAAPVLAAYELSSREGTLLRDLLHGAGDEQMAERVGDTTGSLQAEVSNLLEKVGVESRAALSKKLFADHYLERSRTPTPIGPDGWFATP